MGASLAAHKKEFDSLRDLENQVPEALERVDARLPEARSRVQDSESAITALHGQYAESALAEVADRDPTADGSVPAKSPWGQSVVTRTSCQAPPSRRRLLPAG